MRSPIRFFVAAFASLAAVILTPTHSLAQAAPSQECLASISKYFEMKKEVISVFRVGVAVSRGTPYLAFMSRNKELAPSEDQIFAALGATTELLQKSKCANSMERTFIVFGKNSSFSIANRDLVEIWNPSLQKSARDRLHLTRLALQASTAP